MLYIPTHHPTTVSDLAGLLQDLRQLCELNQRQSQRIVLLQARLATVIDLLTEHGLLGEFRERIGEANHDE